MSTPSMESSLRSKEAGNEHYKNKRFQEALSCYTEALKSCPEESKVVFLKNRSACYIQLGQYENSLKDTTLVLEQLPNDVKTLYRHAQALESLERLPEAFKFINTLIHIDPKNKEAENVARRLTATIKKQAEARQSTDYVVKEMYSVLENKKSTDEKKIKAAKNLAIVSRENAGAKEIVKSDGVTRIVSLLNTTSSEVAHHLLQTLVGLCSNETRSSIVLVTLSLELLTSIVCRPEKDVCGSGVAVLKQALLSFTDVEAPLVKDVVDVAILLLGRQEVSADGRDRVLELIISSVSQVSCSYAHTLCSATELVNVRTNFDRLIF